MKIRHYDEATDRWVIDGASNASELELTNPGFLNEAGESISINNGFTKLDNRITKLEQNVAWIYLNGAKGGGGSGGEGGDGSEYTLEVIQGDTIYTSTSSVTLTILISSGGVKKSFTVTVKDLNTNKVIHTSKIFSMTRSDITLTNITEQVDLEIQAYDNNNIYTTPTYVKVIPGAISLTLQNTPPKTIYMGGISEIPLNFVLTNNILQTPSVFILKINNIEVVKEDDISINIKALNYDLRKLLFDSEYFDPKAGQKFNFEAIGYTTLNGVKLEATPIKFTTTVADSNNLIIVTEGISETEENLTEFGKGSQLSFDYYFSYGLSKYSTFNMDYSIYLVGTEETLLDQGTIKNINKSETNRFVYSTVNLEVNAENEYIKIVLFGYAVNDPGDTTAQYTKTVTCKIVESVSKDLYANNDMHQLLAYYSKVSGFPNTSTGAWNYMPKDSGDFIYEGAFKSKFPEGINLVLKDVNGKTSGFIADSDGINNIPAIVLRGESYGYLEVGDVMFPEVDISSGISFFQSLGFNISCTYKAEQSSYEDEVIAGIAKYENEELVTGYEITLSKVTCKIGSTDILTVKLPQNELLTVDLDVSYALNNAWYFKIYVNGVLSAVSRVTTDDIDWLFGTDFYFGCRNNKGIRTKFSNVNIYDIKIYTSSQSEYAIVQNYISATEQAKLIKGAIDNNLDAELRLKNLFDSAGNCLIWDKTLNEGKGDFISGEKLYNKLIEQMEINTPYPIVLIEETSNSPTLFEAYSTAIFSAADKGTIMDQKFPCKITYQDNKGKVVISTPSGVNTTMGVNIGLQGTSSLSYNAKNFEIYMGAMDETNRPLLFQPREDWLPENEFTLKADVMDSAHVNNVVIGQIINGKATNELGQKITPFTSTPPMALGNDVWGGDQSKADEIRGKIKHTSEGFPVLLFIRYAPDIDGNVKQPKFCGIYNFNLGRYAYYNLGLRLLTDYTKANQDGPTLITNYSELNNYWGPGESTGNYSVEINQNSSAQGAFQQDDMKIVQFMGNVVYTSNDTDTAYVQVQKFYNQMANMALTRIQKYTMDDAGQTPTKPIPGQFYDLDKSAYYNFQQCDKYLNWDNACAYYMLALIFGCVDSMCKNLTLRNWGTNVWYCSFYDMDTAFGLNNAGQDIVEYWAHLHRWYNVNSQDSGLTTFTQQKNYSSNDEVKQYYASWWNRIWEVLENLPTIDSGSTENRTSLESLYINLRTNLFKNPDQFIKDYYQAYTEQTGSIIFNYDYKIKYLSISKTYDVDTGEYQDSTDFSQLKFLHGNRVMHVKDWFKKRIMFLDSVYAYNPSRPDLTLPITVKSPINQMWSDNKASGSSTDTKFTTDISANSKILYHYQHDKTSGAFWLDTTDQEVVVPITQGETIIYIYANKNITNFSDLKKYLWTGLSSIDLPLLERLDLSNISNVDASQFFSSGVYDKNNDKGLKNIKYLNLSNLKLTGNNAAAYTLDLTNCEKIQELDISYSSITKFKLPTSAVLKTLNLSGTNINTLTLENQAFLETLLIDGCLKLTSIEISNCTKLKTLAVPSSVQTITIRGCTELQNISIPYTSVNNSISNLNNVLIDNCPGLKSLNFSGQNNPALKLELTGAWNLEEINLSKTNTLDITFPALYVNGTPNFTSLKSINISDTKISAFKYNNLEFEYLNLITFAELHDIQASNCNSLIKIVCPNNKENPIELQNKAFENCSNLTTINGYFSLEGNEIFKSCSQLKLNSEDTYIKNGTNIFLEGENVTNIKFGDASTSYRSMFESCNTLSYNDFKYIMVRLTDKVTSLEGMFKNCIGISGSIWYDLFRYCPNVISIKEAFSNTQLNGIFSSRTSDYSEDNDSTWGILDFLPNLNDTEAAFAETNLEWIDNNVFAPIGEKYSPILKVDYMFRNCRNLKSCVDTRSNSPKEGLLESKTFFTNLRNLVSTYPKGVFSGCQLIKMNVTNEDGNTYLFHTVENIQGQLILTDSLYSGIKLVGKIGPNVFGGITNELNGYYIPKFSSIKYPFQGSGGELTVNLSEMENMFQNINTSIRQTIGIFKGVKCSDEENSQKIPVNLFKGCSVLNSIESLFEGIDINNNNEVYEFPPKGMFDDCVELTTIKNLFNGCNNLKIKLVGEGFSKCKLSDVSYAFKNSGAFGMIPYRLFYMADEDGIKQTITNMEGVFEGCWCLGYDETRKIEIGGVLIPDMEFTTWDDHIVQTPGNRIFYKLDMSEFPKTMNYETKELEFDSWYLDGYGLEDASSSDETFEQFKESLQEDYLQYDLKQKEALATLDLERSEIGYQNYIIPTDYFRYCSKNCTLENALKGITYKENIKEFVAETGNYNIVTTQNYDGLVGRIPCRIFEALVENTELKAVWKDVNFCAFINLNGNTFERGVKYPYDLFKYNINLENISNMFMNTYIEVGVDINPNLFESNVNLKNISGVWSNCIFDARDYIAEGVSSLNPQIDFENIFKYNTRITNASNLFAVTNIESGKSYGLYFIDKTLLYNSTNINNISNMFYYCANMKGSVPPFQSTMYPVLNVVEGYLVGVQKANITNADELEDRLKPSDWL